MTWDKQKTEKLLRLFKNSNLFVKEIAEQLGESPASANYRLRKLGFSARKKAIKNGRLGGWNSKHSHLRERAMRYYLTHTFNETATRFGLTKSEFKSLLTVSYRDRKLSHIRKDKRRHDSWSFEEIKFLLQHSGLRDRKWIAAKLKRGTKESVKEMVFRLGSNTRYINGLPKRLAVELLGLEIDGFKVKAGPSAPGVDCRPIIVPWVVIYSKGLQSSTIPKHLLDAVGVLARFQKRIHGTRGVDDTVRAVQRCIKGGNKFCPN